MAINDNGTRDQYVASAAQTVFAYTFEIFDKDDIAVEQNGTLLAEGTNYTVSGVGVDAGGSITLLVGATSGDVITLYRDMALERVTDYQQNGDFLANEVNDDFDRLWAATQQIKSTANIGIRPTVDDPILNSSNTELANVATRGGKVLGFTSSGELDYVSAAIASGAFTHVTSVTTMKALAGLTASIDVVQTQENSTGNSGGAFYKTIVGTGTADEESIIAHNTDNLSFVLVRDDEKLDLAQLGIIPIGGSPSIAETITKSTEILGVITNYHNLHGATVFTVPYAVEFDGETLYSGIPQGSSLDFITHDTGYSYPGFISRGYVQASTSIQDNDMQHRLTDGHHAGMQIHNTMLQNTGIGGIGQSTSSAEGKCTIVFQAGFQTVNGREVAGPSCRIQRFKTGSNPTTLALQLPSTVSGTTVGMFAVTDEGNVGIGDSPQSEYNLFIAPDNAQTPVADKRTTLALKNVQPSGSGCKIEMTSRDASATNTMAINYNSGILDFLADDSLQGGFSGLLEQVVFEADMTLGQGRDTPSSSNAVIKPLAGTNNKSIIFGSNTLATGLTSNVIFLETKSVTHSFSYLKFRDDSGTDIYEIDGNGNVFATSFTPFTGCHFFYSDNVIDAACPVDLTSYDQTSGTVPRGDGMVVKMNGSVSPSQLRSKVCAGVVQSCDALEGGGYLIIVAAVGDNVSGELKGFKVNSENGAVEAGDILCTSSTQGELMKLSDGEPESIVRFKAMSDPDNGIVYGYFK